MYNGQGAYQQPAWPQGFAPAPQRTGPPPAKKARGNPIITRYPPPPGYRGPAQPQALYQQQPQAPYQQPQAPYQQQPTWQPQVQPYGFTPTPHSVYPPQNYGAHQSYHQPSIPGYSTGQQQHSAPQYPPAANPQQNYYQPPTASYGFSQSPVWPQQSPFPQTTPQQTWPASNSVPQQRRHHSAPSLHQRTGSVVESVASTTEQAAAEEDLDDDDFLGECYFASHPDDIDEAFSLGWIMWKAALPTKRAMPSTFAEAELEALAPRKPLPTDDESISDYFIKAKRHEALLSIRQTEYWAELKDDIVFKEFPTVCPKIIPTQELLAHYKDRPDPAWSARPFSPTPGPESESESETNGGAMEVDSLLPAAKRRKASHVSEHSDVLGNLEQALQRNGAKHSRRHSRASSTASVSSQKITRPTPLMPVKDQAQEDVLAALGVTGSPKMVYQTPGPAVGAASLDGKSARSSRHNSVTSNHGNSQAQPPPPPPPPPGHPPNHYSTYHPTNGFNGVRRGSNTSQHTATGSDFRSEDENEATPRAKPTNRAEATRKRRYDSESDNAGDDNGGANNEETPKPRRAKKLQRADDPWKARRW